MDGIVYAVCVGMGFAALENIIYLFSNINHWAAIGTMRALFAIPTHFFLAVTMGYYYAKAQFDPLSNRKRNLSLALLLPILFHSVYDAILMVSNVAGCTSATLYLFLGIYIYMATKSKKRFEEHLAIDKGNRDSNPMETKESSNLGG